MKCWKTAGKWYSSIFQLKSNFHKFSSNWVTFLWGKWGTIIFNVFHSVFIKSFQISIKLYFKVSLTAQVCGWVSFRGAHIVCSGKLWKPRRRGSHEQSTVQQLVSKWIQYFCAKSRSSLVIVEYVPQRKCFRFQAWQTLDCTRCMRVLASNLWRHGILLPMFCFQSRYRWCVGLGHRW